MMRIFAVMPVIEIALYQIHRLAETEPMPAILEQAERSAPQKMLKALTEPVTDLAKERTGSAAKNAGGGAVGARLFRSEPPLLERLGAKEAATLIGAYADKTEHGWKLLKEALKKE